MTLHAVVHDTIVLERRFPVAPDKVYAAWSDAAQRARWHFPGGDDWELAEFDQDFRVGGHERARFGPKGAPNFREEGHFLDIVPDDERIVSAGTMHDGEVRMSITLCTVELAADGDGTQLRLTDQSAFLDGRERPDERRSGWGKVLERLADFLRSTS
jgi:uncharacterized protein YndB with AHSA1/START domain